MIVRSTAEARAHLSSLVDAALQGEDVILGRNGKPVARIIPAKEAKKTRTPDGLEDLVIPEDFDKADPEIDRLFWEGTAG